MNTHLDSALLLSSKIKNETITAHNTGLRVGATFDEIIAAILAGEGGESGSTSSDLNIDYLHLSGSFSLAGTTRYLTDTSRTYTSGDIGKFIFVKEATDKNYIGIYYIYQITGTNAKATRAIEGTILRRVAVADYLVYLSQYDGENLDSLTFLSMEELALKPIIIPDKSILVGDWSLVDGFYEAEIADEYITEFSIVEVVPDLSEANGDLVDAAIFQARTDSFSGLVKVYCKIIPTDTIGVSLIIQERDHDLPYAVAYTPENAANKKTDIEANKTSDVFYAPIKAIYDWAVGLFVQKNTTITGATKTKVTYDSKGLVTGGADATTADISDSTNKRYVTDAEKTVIGNTSGTNSGDQDLSGLLKIDQSTPQTTVGTFTFPKVVISQGLVIGGVISPTAISGANNDYNPTGLATSNVIRIDKSGGGLISITGIEAQPDGTVKIIHGIFTSGTVSFPSEDGGSLAVNRFAFPTSTSLVANGTLTIRYDGTSSRWRLI